ncbi:MAG: long-chain fatty acid--CoA ligase [archaeon]|nr:long-chain fatty acid--CoA ligase [archaeon]
MTDDKPWYKYWPENVPKTIEIPKIPLDMYLREAAKKYPDNAATIFYNIPLSYRKLDEIADRIGTYLLKIGIKKGETVALHFTNTPPAIAAYFGILRIGGRVTFLSPLFKPLEVKYQLNDSEAKALIAWEGFSGIDEDVVKETGVKTLIYSSLGAWFNVDPTAPGDLICDDGSKIILEDMIKQTEPNLPKIDINPEEDIACLQYTGGTTGLPKGAMLTHYNIVANLEQVMALATDFDEGKEIILTALPLYHIYAQVIDMHLTIRGCSTQIMCTNAREIENVLDLIEEHKVTYFPGVSALFNAINNFEGVEKRDLSSIKYCFSGAGPLPKEVQDTFESLTGAVVREGFGLTEASPLTHANPLIGRFKNGTVGFPVPNTNVKIVDIETGEKILGINETGELCVKGPQVMKGYYKKEKETNDCIRDGWLYTGDAALIDDEGYLVIKARLKNMIKYKGHSVYPAEIEAYLMEYEPILEVAVVGVPSDDLSKGENIKAYIVLKPEFKGKTSAKEIIEWSKENMAPYKYPREITFIEEELPKTNTGKILHRLLREGITEI